MISHNICLYGQKWDKKKQQYSSFTSTVDSRYLELAYLEKPLISKWKSDSCLNMKI